ncbi:hypothetical protein F0562_012373 [Nyssa sinensis]|uniref:Uncharacterized protein n=1 Tax=Nyssa sinensis TaxID=561372 RepID=A0A5J4ZTK1_9ASTE|nr:hypothetical protein F0562_012373 [Nyssa sinensis]
MRGLNGESSSSVSEGLKGESEMAEVSGQCVNQASFNLGVGFGLVYLITASKNELSKMMELRTQMEILLQDVKEELQSQRRETLSKTSDSNDNLAHSIADALESSHVNGCVPLQNLTSLENPADSETHLVYNQSLNCDACRQEKCVEGMDQLEAELEAELELLQLHLDAEVVLKRPKQQQMEVPDEDTAPEGSLSGSFGEVVDPPEAGTREHFGVPPNELQRRLHELLEARQQERIKELEDALECAKHKLNEKEREVSWWKDSA